MKKVLDRGQYKEAKDCKTCGKVFTKRKKWKNNWDEVLYCSVSCKNSKNTKIINKSNSQKKGQK